jgi:hypothetical protein
VPATAPKERSGTAAPEYAARRPTETMLYGIVSGHLETFLAHARETAPLRTRQPSRGAEARPLPDRVLRRESAVRGAAPAHARYLLVSHALNPALHTPFGQLEQMSALPEESQEPAQSESVEHSTQHE